MKHTRMRTKKVKAWAIVNVPMRGVLMELRGHKSVFKDKTEAEYYLDEQPLTKDARGLLSVVPCTITYTITNPRSRNIKK